MLNNFEILDSIADSMAVINVSGEIIFTNKAWRNFSVENMGELQSVNVTRIVSNYQETIEPLLKSNIIDLKVDIQQTGEFYTNEIEFRSILSNLISNSIKYSDSHKLEKFILFSFSSDAHEAVLKVEDNGIGIKKENIPKIMRRNYQINEKSSDGVGLGLHMVQKFVNNLGGSIKVHSELGKGSTFIVKMPNKSSENP